MEVKSLGALVALVASVAVIVAVPASGGSSDGAAATYVVQLVQAPVAGYEGGISGYSTTRPAKGKKLDASSADAQKYAGYLTAKHDSALARVGGDKVYDYTAVFNGFAARLTEEQAAKLAATKGVVVVERAEQLEVDTSSTPSFLGLDRPGGMWAQLGGVGKGGVGSGAGEDMVIGDVDGGVWPENPAFSARKLDRSKGNLYPHKVNGFSGACETGEAFTAENCNGKIVGARWYAKGIGLEAIPEYEYLSPRDYGGHGTHTAATMAGNYGVPATGDAAPFGRMSGIAPRARLAIYKACWRLPSAPTGSCNSADTTAAIDQAVKDGVDAINYSISGTTTNFTNSVEVSFLFAAAAGVYVSASAGNNGPATSTVAHPSPWITTTAAGTHTRDGRGTAVIDGVTYNGASSAAVPVSAPMAIYGTKVRQPVAPAPALAEADLTPEEKQRLCYLDTLPPSTGKIVFCERGFNGRTDKSLAVKLAGGVGMVMVNPTANSINADLHWVPSIHLESTAYDTVAAAAAAGKTAAISAGTIVYTAPAPFTASFSSRGPLVAGGGDILKPDIIAPGQDILAAVAPPGNHGRDFDLYSGTSMSSPHMTALGTLVKQAHPEWSPMMIKSALMTTSYQTNDYDPFRWGAGHVDPTKALDPGLVFDSGLAEWLQFLKGQGLSTGDVEAIDASDLNSASIAIGDLAGSQTVKRIATSVGSKGETYTFSDTGLEGLVVTPSAASFAAAPGSTTSWTVSFTRKPDAALAAYQKGFIVWTGDQGHVVKMPVTVQPVKFQAPREVSGSGPTGQLTYTVKSGYQGQLSYSIRGLQAATTFDNQVKADPSCHFDTANPEANVAAGTATVNEFTTPPATSYIRFQTFQSDAGPGARDLDMFVYRLDPATGKYVSIASSGGPDANEVVSTTNPDSLKPDAKFKVYVLGCTVEGTAPFTLFAWALTGTASNPFTAVPPTQAVTIGQTVPTTFGWSGLPTGNRYLGRAITVDTTDPAKPASMTATVIAVSTR
jgi:subtilisin family serine protease